MLTALLVLMLQPTTYRLTVIGGTGSGLYACGAPVKIVGDRKHGAEVFGQWFDGWTGTAIDRVTQRKAVLTMPCHDQEIQAMFVPKGKR